MVTMKIVKKTDRVERVLDGIGVQQSISYEAKLTKLQNSTFAVRPLWTCNKISNSDNLLESVGYKFVMFCSTIHWEGKHD